jgi:hypothetical protein
MSYEGYERNLRDRGAPQGYTPRAVYEKQQAMDAADKQMANERAMYGGNPMAAGDVHPHPVIRLEMILQHMQDVAERASVIADKIAGMSPAKSDGAQLPKPEGALIPVLGYLGDRFENELTMIGIALDRIARALP